MALHNIQIQELNELEEVVDMSGPPKVSDPNKNNKLMLYRF